MIEYELYKIYSFSSSVRLSHALNEPVLLYFLTQFEKADHVKSYSLTISEEI